MVEAIQVKITYRMRKRERDNKQMEGKKRKKR